MPDLISSWGVEDRCMVDGMIDFITQAPARPFFLMGWTTQTHHPYEPTPGVPLLDLAARTGARPVRARALPERPARNRSPSRTALRHRFARLGLDEDTLIVVIGDHGQAFGYPHDTYIQGRTMYEEDVHVPLMFWFPRHLPDRRRDRRPWAARSIWRRRSPSSRACRRRRTGRGAACSTRPRSPRAYFYVAEDHFTLGVREGNWKYIFDLREGVEELYDLDRDPDEQHNLAKGEPARRRACGSGWRRGRKPIAGSTNAPTTR